MKLFFPSTSLNISTRDTYLIVIGCNFISTPILKVSKKTNTIKIMNETESIQRGGGEMAWKTVLKYPEEEKTHGEI